METIVERLVLELGIKRKQVENTIKLIEEGNTIPFIARYRKEVTGNLDDETLRNFNDRLTYLKNLEDRKKEVINIIEEQGKLTEELRKNIENASILNEVEDLYLPYKQKKRTRATIAKEKGLQKLAEIILIQRKNEKPIEDLANLFINNENGIENIEQAISGACDIIAEDISENAYYRKNIRRISYITGKIISTAVNKDEKTTYDMYYNFSQELNKIPSHRILAINRGEKEEVLKVKVEVDEEQIIDFLESKIIKKNSPYDEILKDTIKDSYKRLIKPSIEREIRSEKFEEASEKAIKIFGVNLKNLIMGAPLKGLTIMGFDPAYRTGCKIAIIDETGKLLDYTTIYPTEPQNDIKSSTNTLLDLIKKYKVNMISIGNGTASRESESFVSTVIKEAKKKLNLDVYYTIVSEAGASVYSASKLATKEYPDINVSIRGAISIARRLQDPMAELVKIDPKSIGVGQYQHDVNQKRLSEALSGVVEDAVNSVGVDINTATPSLLSYVSGINSSVSENIVKYREENGKFKNRKDILKVPKLGKVSFVQCAGFLKVPESNNILDNTMVHPESYEVTQKLIEKLGFDIKKIDNNTIYKINNKLANINVEETAKELEIGIPTLEDIISELKKPGRDLRDDLPKPILKSDVLNIDDLKEGLILNGTVRNVTAFGAFVDIGIKSDGLVHVSQLSDKYVRDPMEEVSVGQVVKVRVIGIDKERGKVSLSMKDTSEV